MDKLLVAFQFGILAVLIVWTGTQDSHQIIRAVPVMLLAASLVMGAWAVAANRPGNFNISPTPKAGGSLVTSGPYRWIRHPMYTSVLLFGLACATVIESLLGWLAWAVLLIVIWSKARLEEKYMTDAHETYQNYMVGTRRFIPWIF